MIRSATTKARLAIRSAARSQSTHASSKPCAPRMALPPPTTVAKQNQSTLALESLKSGSAAVSLTRDQVRSVFLSAAIPMVGFGFMDNFIMITAGSAIDSTLGVQMGLATMTAAAMGQIVSDVSGVLFGDTLARAFKVAPAHLSDAQKKLALVGRLRLGGAVAGIIVGCCLGATALKIIPDEPREQEAASSSANAASVPALMETERVRESLDRLRNVMHDVMTSHDDPWREKLASCTLYARNLPRGCCPPEAEASQTRARSFFGRSSPGPRASIANLEGASDPEVGHTLREGRVVVFADTIYVPVLASGAGGGASNTTETTGEVLGIVKIKLDNGSFYTGSEIRDAKRMARNLGFFLNRMVPN